MINNPLEQFTIFNVHSCLTSNYTNVLILHFFVFLGSFYFLNFSVLTKNILHLIFTSLFDLVKVSYFKNTNLKVTNYIFIFFYIFLIILFGNLFGLIPYSYSITSSLIFNFYIIFTIFFVINLVGIIYHKWNFFGIFMPKGLPLILTWFLIFFELVSYAARIFSLTIRLFANILSGHILQHILISFSYKIFITFSSFSVVFFLPWVIAFLVSCLELAICFLQAYVLLILLLIYFGNTINLH